MKLLFWSSIQHPHSYPLPSVMVGLSHCLPWPLWEGGGMIREPEAAIDTWAEGREVSRSWQGRQWRNTAAGTRNRWEPTEPSGISASSPFSSLLSQPAEGSTSCRKEKQTAAGELSALQKLILTGLDFPSQYFTVATIVSCLVSFLPAALWCPSESVCPAVALSASFPGS